jgi:hypothetical protein
MDWSRGSQLTAMLLVGLAVLVAILGFFMTDIRDMLIFKPRRERAQTAVMQLVARESALHKANGQYDVFAPADAALHLPKLGVNMQDLPSDDFLFEASLMPNSHLRIRALPRPEAVQDLRVGAQMFVAELAPSGGVSQSGWYP